LANLAALEVDQDEAIQPIDALQIQQMYALKPVGGGVE